MPVPMLCLDDELRHFADRYHGLFSKPQYQYFVIVLLGLMMGEGRRTLSGLLRIVGTQASLAGLSRFLSQAPWHEQEVVQQWRTHFRQEMNLAVEAERHRQRQHQPKRRGRPKQPS